MKTLKLFLTALTLFTAFTAANAKENTTPVLPLQDYAIYTYVNVMCHGNLNGVDEVFDKNAKFSMVRGKSVVSSDKDQMVKYWQQSQHVEQDCTVSTSVVDSNADVTVVKVDMKYENFTRSNYVTIANTADGWKITNVHSVFKS